MVPGWSTFWDTRHTLTDEAIFEDEGSAGGSFLAAHFLCQAGNSKGHGSMKNAWGEEAEFLWTKIGEWGMEVYIYIILYV